MLKVTNTATLVFEACQMSTGTLVVYKSSHNWLERFAMDSFA